MKFLLNYSVVEKLTGIFPALVTPFTAEDRLDLAAVRRVVEYNLKKGVDGFYVGAAPANPC